MIGAKFPKRVAQTRVLGLRLFGYSSASARAQGDTTPRISTHRNARIEKGLRQSPATTCTDTLRQGFRVVVGEPIPEGLLGSIKEVLSVYKRDGEVAKGYPKYSAEIDKVIEAHRGWPGAFLTGKPSQKGSPL
jgi:hypothetical protein